MNLKHQSLARLYFLFLAISLTFSNLNAQSQQQETDSLISFLQSNPRIDTVRAEVLSRLSYLYNSSDAQLGLTYGEEALKIADMLGNNWSRARAYNSLGVNYFALGDNELAINNYKKAIASMNEEGDQRGMAMTKINVGLIYWRSFRYADALREYNEALGYFEDTSEENVKASIYINLGLLYKEVSDEVLAFKAFEYALAIGKSFNLYEIEFNAINQLATLLGENKQFTESLQFRQLALGLARNQGDEIRMATAFSRVGRGFSELEMLDSAIHYFNQAIQLSMKTNNITQLANGYTNIGNIYFVQNRYDLAESSFIRAINIYTAIESQRSLTNALQDLGRLHSKLGLNEKARTAYLNSLLLSEEIGHLEGILESSVWLSESYESTKEYTRALLYNRKHQLAKDSILNEDKIKEYAKLESQIAFEKEKQNLLVSQAAEELKLQSEIDSQKLIQRIALVGLIGLLTLAIVYYRFYKIKTSINLELGEKNSQINLQKEAISEQAHELEQSNIELKKLGEFKTGLTQMIAHDMKNPLNTIIGLSEGKLDKSKAKDVSNAGYQILQLVTNMLDVDKFEQAEIDPHYEYSELDKIVLESKNQIELLLNAKSILLKNLIPKHIHVKIDKDLMTRVVVNILTNSVKYSSNNGVVSITHSKPDNPNYINLIITDSGTGISTEKLPKVFDKFWTSEDKKSGVGMSTGLGLTFCKMAVEAHGGEITVESQLDQGTIVTFSLPLAIEKNDETIWEDVVETQHEDLIFESERLILETFSDALKSLKVYQVGEITKILKDLEEKEIQSKWKSNLETAIYLGDQEKFDELVGMIN
jgi:signal transduction histidine kinase/Tfp pilus assembly protein PilF